MTAGKYIKELLKKKSVKISALANTLGLSSRNTLYRLFNDDLNREHQREIVDKIKAVVPFSPEEAEELNSYLQDTEENKFTEEVTRILMTVYSPCERRCIIEGQEIYDIFSSQKEVEFISMFGVRDEAIIDGLYKFLKENPTVTVYHYMKFPKSNTLSAYEILALIRLSEFVNYMPMELDGMMQRGIYIISRSKKRTSLQLIDFTEHEPVLLDTQISNKSYEYIIQKNKRLKSKSTPIKRQIDRVQSYMSTLEDTLEIEEGNSIYCEGAPCFGYLPMNTLYELFKSVNFLGYPESHRYVQHLIAHMKEKNARLYSLGHKRFLYDEKHLKSLMQTGFAIDHVSEFPPMTPEQRREYFKWLIAYLKQEDKNITCRMLKNVEVMHSYVHEAGHMLYMFRPNSEQVNMDVSVIMLKDRAVDEIMNIFTEHVWENLTFSEEETIMTIERMASEYLGI